jgi:hypothetical protein
VAWDEDLDVGLVCSDPALEGPDLQISIVDFPYAPELPSTAAGETASCSP